MRYLRKCSKRWHSLPLLDAADIRLTKPCTLRQLRWCQVFFIPGAKNHHHPLIARFILIPFFFEISILHLLFEISIEILHFFHRLQRLM